MVSQANYALKLQLNACPLGCAAVAPVRPGDRTGATW